MSRVSPSPPPPPQPASGGGMAVAALVLGICSILPGLGIILGLVAVILGIVALANKRGSQGQAIAGLALGVLLGLGQLVLIPMVLLPSLNRARELAKRAMCGGNLSATGKFMSLYAAEYQDKLPPDLETLVTKNYLSPDALKCPSAKRARPHYFYFAPKDGNFAPAYTLVACDFRDNHKGEGRNILLLNGNVMWESEAAFQTRLADRINADFAAALRQAEGEGP